MTMKQKLFFGMIALAAAAPELVSRVPDRPDPTEVPVAAAVAQEPPSEGVTIARRGSALHDDRAYADAVLRFDSAAQKLPQLEDWLNAFAASSLSFLGDTTEVNKRLATLDSLMAHDWSWRTRARAYSTAKAHGRALEFATAAARSGSASKRASAWLFAAEMQKELGRASDQRVSLRRAMEIAPYSDGARDAARMLAAFARPTPSEQLLAGRTLLRNGEPSRGIDVLHEWLERGQALETRAQVRYEIGSALFGMDSYRSAERELNRVPSNHARAADARFLIGRAQYRQGKEAAGSATFRKVAADYPRSRAATRALFFLGDLAQDNRRFADAARYFKQAADREEYGGDEVSLALMRLGTLQYQQKDFAAAQKTFETYRKRAPRSEQAAFWLAQSIKSQGKNDSARAQLQQLDARRSLSYYDVRAAQLLDNDFLKDLPAGPAAPTTPQPHIDEPIDRWMLLRDIGWNEAASFELARVKRDVAGNTNALYTIAEHLNENGHPYAGITTGRELLDKGESWNTRLLRILYPLPYQDIIERESRKHGVDPFFVAALMRQESRFNPRARSGANAIGLMQVVPATGRQLARGENMGTIDAEKLTDPDINIRLGTKFLGDLMKTWQSRPDAVLVAYNAGPSRMERWRSFPEFADPDLFVERIPFSETRDYVRVVRVNTTIYHALYRD